MLNIQESLHEDLPVVSCIVRSDNIHIEMLGLVGWLWTVTFYLYSIEWVY